jgi:uncharacterized protein YecE (DUF72 family)
MPAAVKVGITAWTERTLVASGFYPPAAHDAESRLRFYATQFPIVENDSAYYALPERRTAELWAMRTPPGFTMNVKAFATLTEHYTDARRLPPDLRERLPDVLRARARLYPHDLNEALLVEIVERFRDAVAPLRDAGKLGVVLFQYPVWFPCSPENRAKLVCLPGLLPGCRIAVELRNATWMNARHRDETISLLRDLDLVYTCVDEPQGFASSIPPIAAATSSIALARFHGKNRATWLGPAATASDRFRYRYEVRELAAWVPRIAALADRAREVHVLMNNCHNDDAVVNARQMTELLVQARLNVVPACFAPPANDVRAEA